jgi:hypothetical protein
MLSYKPVGLCPDPFCGALRFMRAAYCLRGMYSRANSTSFPSLSASDRLRKSRL